MHAQARGAREGGVGRWPVWIEEEAPLPLPPLLPPLRLTFFSLFSGGIRVPFIRFSPLGYI